MKWKVLKSFGKYRVGAIVDDSDLYIRRKIKEGGGCLEKMKAGHENKMAGKIKNKGVE